MNEDEQDRLMYHIYQKYGRPNKIDHVKVVFYNGWNSGNCQRGRVFVYHWVDCPKGGPEKINIASYFLKKLDKTVRVYTMNCNRDPDLVILL